MRKAQINVAFAQAAIDQLSDLADKRGVSVAHVVRAAVAAYLLDPDADLRRQLGVAPVVAAPTPVVAAPPAPGIWRRPTPDPLAPTC